MDLDSKVDALAHSGFLVSLGSETRQEIARCAHRRVYGPGQMIVVAHDPSEAVYLVVQGQVQTCRYSPAGRMYVLNDCGPGEVFNLASVFGGRSNLATVTAISETIVYAIPLDSLCEIAGQDHALREAILRHLAGQVRHLTDAVTGLAFYSVRARLARFLLQSAQRRSNQVQYRTQREIARRIGTVRAVVGRALRSFARKSLIKRKRGQLIVTDKPGLEREAMYKESGGEG